jgi:uncharacterized protein (TIGR03435 family)
MKKSLCIAGSSILAVCSGLAQSVGGQPRFEVASVKAAPPDAESSSMNGGPLPAGAFNQGNRDPGRITWTNVRLKRMMQVAYDLPPDRISGPGWLDSNGYSVVATVPMGTTVSDFRVMVQSLLAERFKLAVHRETKEVSGYALEVGKNGPKIKSSAGNETRTDGDFHSAGSEPGEAAVSKALNALVVVDSNGFPAPRPGNPYYPPGTVFEVTIAVNGGYRTTGLNEPMAKVAELLGRLAGAPVQDRTGLTGKYDVRLECVASGTGTAGTGDAPVPTANDPGPSIFDAVQLQLGLKLTPHRVPVEMLVVDRAKKVPTED